MYDIAICDDDSSFIKYIINLLIQSGLKKEEVIFYTYSSGEELIQSLATCAKIDLLVLTTLMFTSLFTILMSINSSYQTYQFKQAGGYAHGTFKNVTQEQKEDIRQHPNVKEVGERVIIGMASDGPFEKELAEICQ